jgi:hypothetical protein
MLSIAILILIFPTGKKDQVAGSNSKANPGDFLLTSLFLNVDPDYKIMLPVILMPPPPAPPYSISRYISTTDDSTMENLGRSEGERGITNAIVILNFGSPYVDDLEDPQIYGTYLFDYTSTPSIFQIEGAVKKFLYGYHSTAPANTFITVAIGTSNSGNSLYLSGQHGIKWAEMVNRIESWIKSSPSWEYQMEVAGAIDIEPAYNTAADTKPWAEAYDSVNTMLLYNFGSCDSCPYRDRTDWTPEPFGWSLDDIWYVSYGLPPVLPIPQIYAKDVPYVRGYQAYQWQSLKYYGITCDNNCLPQSYQYRSIEFMGALTQYDSCHDPNNAHGPACIRDKLDNSPEEGWQLFWIALNSDPTTAQDLSWSTDISWKK